MSNSERSGQASGRENHARFADDEVQGRNNVVVPTLEIPQEGSVVAGSDEIPLVKLVETVVPDIEVKEVVRTVPRIVPEYKEKVVEVPVIKTVEKIVEEPMVRYNVKYVPKEEIVEKVVTKPVIEYKTVEKIVEKVTYVEEPEKPFINAPESLPIFPPSSVEMDSNTVVNITRVPVGEAVPSLIELPVPYMVPKPFVVPVHVPVLEFRDHFVPIPVRKRVVPKFKMTEEVYEVECVREVPYFVYEDIIKPVPVDVEFGKREREMDVHLMNPAELSQADFHAMWMRVNADLLEERRILVGELEIDRMITPYREAMDGIDSNQEPSLERMQSFERQMNLQRQLWDPLPMSPGNPLMMTYLQNQWILTPTIQTQEMYTQEFFMLQQQAVYNLVTGAPQQVNLAPHQISLCGCEAAAGVIDIDSLPSGAQNLIRGLESKDVVNVDTLGPMDQTPIVTYPIQQCIPMAVLGAAPLSLPKDIVPIKPENIDLSQQDGFSITSMCCNASDAQKEGSNMEVLEQQTLPN
ncbi:articulin family [Cryptosporidium xiaoi]|uniref:Articulin family n=1 Tax=Cryptosporidium xiaoi TaxID=659607 RepID=A0AAV9Y0F4_9CRYT